MREHRYGGNIRYAACVVVRTFGLAAFFVAAAAGVSAPRVQAAELVGTTPAKFGVTPHGAASYSVPIAVPPGTMDLKPEIVLQYNSQDDNGLLGVGWSIAGLSYITRCPSDLYVDDPAHGGIGIDPVDYDQHDKFCLNGERLVAVSGAYGANGTEYRTFFEEFSKIVSYGSIDGGPSHFRVWKRTGEILDYGVTENAKVRGQSREAVRSWALSKLADAKGNYITYLYNNDRANGEFSIHEIYYTGNDSQGLVPYNAITFQYETRPDLVLAYHNGDKIQHSKRLKTIQVLTDTQLAREYRLAYTSISAAPPPSSGYYPNELWTNGKSRLASITECATPSDCFKPTTFAWLNGYLNQQQKTFNHKVQLGYTGGSEFPLSISSANSQHSGDFNGDGLTDIIYGPNFRPVPYLSLGNGTFTNNGNATPPLQGYSVHAVGDLNGDSLSDVYVSRATGSAPDYIYYGNRNGTLTQFPVAQGLPAKYKVVASGDFDGDGLTDLYIARVESSTSIGVVPAGQSKGQPDQIWLANSDGTFRRIISTLTDSLPDGAGSQVGDFNGDGRADLFVRAIRAANNSGADTARVWLSNGNGSFSRKADISLPNLQRRQYDPVALGDFNGDRLTDFFLFAGSGSAWLSKGDGSFVQRDTHNLGAGPFKVFVAGDFDGDGHTDLLAAAKMQDGRVACHIDSDVCIGYAQTYVLKSKGNGTFEITVAWFALGAYQLVDVVGDFNGDGLTDYSADVYASSNDGNPTYSWKHVDLSNYQGSDRIVRLVNSHGLTTDITYKPLTDPSVYSKGTGATYPVQEEIPAALVVSSVKIDNGIGGKNEQTHTYAGLRGHLRGLGNLGFASMTLRDVATGIRTETVYSQDWTQHRQGLLLQSRTIAANGTALKDKTLTWGLRGYANAEPGTRARCFRFNSQSVTTNRDLNGAFMSRLTENSVYDDYGFATEETDLVANESGSRQFGETTQSTYQHNIATWRLGMATNVTLTSTAPGQPNDVRTSSFTYDADGYVITETADPGTPLFTTKTNTRNGFGAITAVSQTWGGTGSDGIEATSRITSYEYDAKKRFVTKETNPLGHIETTSYHPIFGIPATKTGPNGLTTSYAYDVFGRLGTTTEPDGTTTTVTRSFCGGSVACVAGAIYKVHSIEAGGQETEADFNVLNKELRTGNKIDGRFSYVDKTYDALAREVEESAPYFAGETRHLTVNQYDVLGRKTRVTRPDGSFQTAAFNGLIEVDTNELGETRTIEKDERDKQIAVTDARGQVITYGYDAAGRLISMVADGKVTSYGYDLYGNKISDSDPDKGSWTYRYNAFGDPVEQTNARGEVTRMTYDLLERMIGRIDNADAPGAASRTSAWVYDTAVKGIGKLHRAASGLASSGGLEGYTLTNSYDSLGRIITSVETVDGESFTSATSYDQYSRPATLTYPSTLSITNLYDGQGALSEARNSAGGATLWQRLGVDARGNITRFMLGNGVESFNAFDAKTGRLTGIYSNKGTTVVQDLSYTKDFLGNLTKRQDKRQSLVEDFTYDNLNRVTQIDTAQYGGTPTTVTLTYSANGNILTKSDVGSYSYGQVHGGCASGFAGPHAVTQITGVKNTTYCYDANGNMVSGDGRTVEYAAYDMPTRIAKGGNAVSFFYGPDRKRYKRIDETVADGVSTTIYVADRAYERLTKASETTEKVYIGDFAVMTRTTPTSGGGSVTTDYLHRDHLGSVDVITDAAGAVAQEMSFDAFGKRRESNWQPYDELGIINFDTSITTRGFTNHEQVDPVGLVHMNGRVYEPEIGRFLSADPIVENIDNLQTYNRYSYVRNNPLTHTDPSGFWADPSESSDDSNVGGSDGGGTSAHDSAENTDPSDKDQKGDQPAPKADPKTAYGLGMAPAQVAMALQTHALGTTFTPTVATQTHKPGTRVADLTDVAAVGVAVAVGITRYGWKEAAKHADKIAGAVVGFVGGLISSMSGDDENDQKAAEEDNAQDKDAAQNHESDHAVQPDDTNTEDKPQNADETYNERDVLEALDIDKKRLHEKKREILNDFRKDLKKTGVKNPDIGFDKKTGNINFRDPRTKQSIHSTDTPISNYRD
jgi:RHS repeat-associated protein